MKHDAEITPFADKAVQAVFESRLPDVRARLLALRELIFETARQTEGVGTITECLKWGQPSYLTSAPKSGTTIRIDAVRDDPSACAIYVHCQTSLIGTFRDLYEDRLAFQGNRAVLVSCDEPLPADELKHCIAQALTYNVRKTGL